MPQWSSLSAILLATRGHSIAVWPALTGGYSGV